MIYKLRKEKENMNYERTSGVRIPKFSRGKTKTETELLPRQKLSNKISKIEESISIKEKKQKR